jgi:yecA family protein
MQDNSQPTGLPDYDEISAALEDAGIAAEAAELQGLLCGLLSSPGTATPERWLATLSVPADVEVSAATMALLDRVFSATVVQLESPGFEFQLLLPDDDTPLEQRVAALAVWCQGLMLGIATAGYRDSHRLPDASREFMDDVNNISTAERFDLSAGEEDERAYAELVEYLRVGMLMLIEELRPVAAPSRD